ncbi:MAG: hypothetical protein WC901_07300 [Candidatus Margulisiibacteriota bacterium]
MSPTKVDATLRIAEPVRRRTTHRGTGVPPAAVPPTAVPLAATVLRREEIRVSPVLPQREITQAFTLEATVSKEGYIRISDRTILNALYCTETTAQPLILFHPYLYEKCKGQALAVNIRLFALGDPVLSVAIPERTSPSIEFGFDLEHKLAYWVKSTGAAGQPEQRYYICQFPSSNRSTLFNLLLCRADEKLAEIILLQTEGREVTRFLSRYRTDLPIRRPIYNNDGTITGYIIGRDQDAAFSMGITGTVGPFSAYKEGNSFRFPSSKGKWLLSAADAKALGITEKHPQIWITLEDGFPIMIFGRDPFVKKEDDETNAVPLPAIYFRVLRGKNWKILGSARERLHNVPQGIPLILEGVETNLLDAPDGSKSEVCTFQRMPSLLAVHPSDRFTEQDPFVPRHASLVLAGDKNLLFSAFAPCFTGFAKEVAAAVLTAYGHGLNRGQMQYLRALAHKIYDLSQTHGDAARARLTALQAIPEIPDKPFPRLKRRAAVRKTPTHPARRPHPAPPPPTRIALSPALADLMPRLATLRDRPPEAINIRADFLALYIEDYEGKSGPPALIEEITQIIAALANNLSAVPFRRISRLEANPGRITIRLANAQKEIRHAARLSHPALIAARYEEADDLLDFHPAVIVFLQQNGYTALAKAITDNQAALMALVKKNRQKTEIRGKIGR